MYIFFFIFLVEEEADDKKEEVTVELVEIVQEINLSELKEFECLPRRKRVKGKEKDTKSKIADFSLGKIMTY